MSKLQKLMEASVHIAVIAAATAATVAAVVFSFKMIVAW